MGYKGMLPGGVFGNGVPYFIRMPTASDSIPAVTDTSGQVEVHGVVVNGMTPDEAIQNYMIATHWMPHRVSLPGQLRSVYFRMNGATELEAVPLETAIGGLPHDANIILLRTPRRGSILVPPEGIERLVE